MVAFFFPRWLVVVVCLYLEAGGCLHFQRSNLAKHLKMFSIKIFYSKIFYLQNILHRNKQSGSQVIT